jgi:hypothetical protein
VFFVYQNLVEFICGEGSAVAVRLAPPQPLRAAVRWKTHALQMDGDGQFDVTAPKDRVHRSVGTCAQPLPETVIHIRQTGALFS